MPTLNQVLGAAIFGRAPARNAPVKRRAKTWSFTYLDPEDGVVESAGHTTKRECDHWRTVFGQRGLTQISDPIPQY